MTRHQDDYCVFKFLQRYVDGKCLIRFQRKPPFSQIPLRNVYGMALISQIPKKMARVHLLNEKVRSKTVKEGRETIQAIPITHVTNRRNRKDLESNKVSDHFKISFMVLVKFR